MLTQESNSNLPPEDSQESIGDIRYDNFLRLANKRLEASLEEIRKIKNLFANPYRYAYSSEDAELIYRKLYYAIEEIKHYRRERVQ